MSEAELVREATQFIESVHGQRFAGSFGEYLKDGVVLCEFLNKLKPGSVKSFKKSKMPFVCMENISAYTQACKTLGLPDEYNFVTVDLWEGARLKQVALNVVSLKRQLGFGFDKVAKEQINVSVGADQTTKAAAAAPPRPAGALGKAQACRECNLAVTSGSVELHTPDKRTVFYYHPKCFNCKKCGVNLKKGQGAQHEAQPYCDKCILIVNPKSSLKAATRDMGFTFN